MSRKPENTHIPIDQCKDGYAYRIDARNGSVGIYSAERKSFAIVRNKFGSTFIDEEFRWDTGAPYGTVKPLVELCKRPACINSDSEEIAWLKAREEECQE